MTRRSILGVLLALPALGVLTSTADALPRVRVRRRIRRRVRRKVRRIRRRVAWRVVAGRRLIVVPVACAVGWELMVDNRVGVVQSMQPGAVVVSYDGGPPETVPVMMENTPENSQELPGTEYETEVEEEVDE